MVLLGRFLATFLAGYLVGSVLRKLKVPGGMLVGGIIGAAILNVVFEAAYVPVPGKVLAQITAGAFIGASVNKKDLHQLRKIYKPASILLSVYLILNLALGFLIHGVSSLDLATALFSAVPGGISDIPIIAADMGADAPKVATMQFVRLLFGIAVFPGLIERLAPQASDALPLHPSPEKKGAAKGVDAKAFFLTLLVATLFGSLGFFSGLPAGTLVFSLAGVLVLNTLWGKAFLPMWMKRLAQSLSGVYIGSSIMPQDLLELPHIILPAILLVLGYTLNFIVTGSLLRRVCHMSRRESMLAAVPAGASDMALISMDMGVQSTDLVVLQVLRLVIVSSVFPQIIYFVLQLAG